jgi:hypothetical protein
MVKQDNRQYAYLFGGIGGSIIIRLMCRPECTNARTLVDGAAALNSDGECIAFAGVPLLENVALPKWFVLEWLRQQ